MFFTSFMITLEGDSRADYLPKSVAYEKESDESLLHRIMQGDQLAFKQLYQNTDRAIYSFILSILKNQQDAEEVMQETYLKIWTSAHMYQAQGKPLAWMFTITRNLCYMKLREKKHYSDIPIEDLEKGEICPQIENVADKLVLQTALEILKEDERQIVLLHASAGLKHREIAKSMNMPLATVLSKYNRAIKKLGTNIKERSG